MSLMAFPSLVKRWVTQFNGLRANAKRWDRVERADARSSGEASVPPGATAIRTGVNVGGESISLRHVEDKLTPEIIGLLGGGRVGNGKHGIGAWPRQPPG